MPSLEVLALVALSGTVALNFYLLYLIVVLRRKLCSWAWFYIFAGFLALFALVAASAWHLVIWPIPRFRYNACFLLLIKALCFALGFTLFERDLKAAQKSGLYPLRTTNAPKLD